MARLLQRNNSEPKALKALPELGFTAEQIEGQVAERSEGVRDASPVKTISLRHFSFPIVYAAAKPKPQAIAEGSEDWRTQALQPEKTTTKTLKALQGLSFTAVIIERFIDRSSRMNLGIFGKRLLSP